MFFLQIAVLCILFFFMVLSVGLFGNYISKKENFPYAGPIFSIAFTGMIIFGVIIYFAYHS